MSPNNTMTEAHPENLYLPHTRGRSVSTSSSSSNLSNTPPVNLSSQFEELYLTESAEKQKPPKSFPDVIKKIISPSCVIEEATASTTLTARSESPSFSADTSDRISMPDFDLHTDLRVSLTQEQINRISFYSIIHDVNKEASAMSSNDSVDGELALIDEEHWLLSVIATASPLEIINESDDCEGTFPPTNSRTQLWKPSRSWWEARSGKNPWIEPRSHNKRWRYLWPMIHYHKFLTRCIKKLKRNGIDVKTSTSPVSIFLRTEVTCVGNHLGEVSKFGAEEWLRALAFFRGWTDVSETGQEVLREVVGRVKVRVMGGEEQDGREKIGGCVVKVVERGRLDDDTDYAYTTELYNMGDSYAPPPLPPKQQSNNYNSAKRLNPKKKTNKKQLPRANSYPPPHMPGYSHGYYPYMHPPQFYPPHQPTGYHHPPYPLHDHPQNYYPHPPHPSHPSEFYYPPHAHAHHHHNPHSPPTPASTPGSPYWGHLDPMAGISSPSPYHQKRNVPEYERDGNDHKADYGNSKHLFLNPNHYPTAPHAGGNTIPPSPATQFLSGNTSAGWPASSSLGDVNPKSNLAQQFERVADVQGETMVEALEVKKGGE